MPKIIRSAGINIDLARPLVMPWKGQEGAASTPDPVVVPEPEPELLPVSEPEPEPEPEQEPKPDIDQIYASAEIVVQEIISKARNDADNILVDARLETIKLLQDAMREGWDQGMEEARKEARTLKEAAVQEVDGAIESLIDERRRMFCDLERDVLALVFDIVDKVLAVELPRNDEWVASLVKMALAEMEGDNAVVLKVSAAARQRVLAAAETLLATAGKPPSRLTVVTDDSLKPGGCVIETAKGSIDASAENKLEKLKTTLWENA